MTSDDVKSIQQQLSDAGFYHGAVDGAWGPLSANAFHAAMLAAGLRDTNSAVPPVVPLTGIGVGNIIAWGAKVSATFKSRVLWVSDSLHFNPSWLMACMAWESGETFSADIKNAAGSGAVGLIQFMPSTAVALGTTSEALAEMTPEIQLNYVYKYFLPYSGKINNLGDLYMAILWPLAVGQPDDFVLFDRNDPKYPKRYAQNAGIDVDKNGKVTKAEAYGKVAEKLAKGQQIGFLG